MRQPRITQVGLGEHVHCTIGCLIKQQNCNLNFKLWLDIHYKKYIFFNDGNP